MKMKFALSLLIVVILTACTKQPSVHNSERYIVTSPELAEIITKLQGDKNIVGIAIECDYPASLNKKEKIGSFGSVSYEKILALEPTIVFTTGLEQAKLTADIQKAGIKTSSYYPKTVSEMLTCITSIGLEIGEQEAAGKLVDSLNIELEKLRLTLPEKSPTIYVEIYGDPIMSVSDSSFVGELINLAGMENIFPKLVRDYCRVRSEDVIIAEPEIILLTYPGNEAKDIIDRKGWQSLPACQNNSIYTIKQVNPDLILRATPRIIDGIKQLRSLINE